MYVYGTAALHNTTTTVEQDDEEANGVACGGMDKGMGHHPSWRDTDYGWGDVPLAVDVDRNHGWWTLHLRVLQRDRISGAVPNNSMDD